VSKPIRVLVVEDDEVDWMALSRRFRELTDEFTLTRVNRVCAATDALAAGTFDCALLDVNLPDGHGLDLLENTTGVAAVMMTGQGETGLAVEAMRRGATDFVIKQPSGEHLTTLPGVIERAHREQCALRELDQYRNNLEAMVASRTRDLEEEIARRVEVENDLNALLAVREALLQEVHHRVKNNLQVISSLLNLQAQSDSGDAQRELLDASIRRIQAMALVHEQIYQSPSFEDVDISEYLNELSVTLADGYGARSVNIVVDCDSLRLHLNSIIPVGLIVTELLTNAFKHAFPENHETRTVYLSAEETPEETIQIRVRDTGIGIPTDAHDDQKPVTESLGLTIVRMLTEQLHGSIEQQMGEGTVWTLTIPADPDA
jgi:two-component sensor histidine kinase